ncbi:very-long-chain enoyl-CoA reductase-like isoform X2 [Alligator sinensis]|uniref:Very-long-chain enoyl-CoA reductase-like isoform X2 n=1 Tax=Alligator sinensis TaxID=38654 RepID=A0A3Q0GHM2_ALLSI|nr:very-long-chain enoyl-CoA reductase-like isoform X2 [Alligator sinensis]
MFHKSYPQWYPARQSIRLKPKGKALRDEEILQNLPVGTTATLYFKDLGPQIGWTMVFLIEYAGPLFIYFLFYFRMPFVYGLDERFTSRPHPVVNLACICHSFHYIKRLIETVFVHRFSHGTMPLRNIVKNCLYYWGFAAWLAYYINHPLYTPPSYGQKQINIAVIMFLLCEAGNFSIHVALSDLRRDGSKIRKIPYPTKNPFTWLFFFVSCPNYTYEDRIFSMKGGIHANSITRNVFNFLGQTGGDLDQFHCHDSVCPSGIVYFALLYSDDNLGKR